MEQNNNLKSYFSFINVFILLLFAVVVGVISSLTTYSLLSPKLLTQPPIIPQTQPNVLPTTAVLPTSSAVDETADWKVYRNKEFGFLVKYPSNLEATRNPIYSILFQTRSKEQEGPPSRSFFLYVSIISEEVFNSTTPSRLVYNFEEKDFIDSFFNMNIGQVKQQMQEVGPFWIYKKLSDVTVAGQKGVTIENNNVWESDGFKDRRVFIKNNNVTYMLGTYYKTTEDLNNFIRFVSSFELIK